MTPVNIALVVCIVIFIIVISLLAFSGTSNFKNLVYAYKLPVLGTIPNIQMATLARMRIVEEPTSSEEPVSSEPTSSEEPGSSEEPYYSDQSLLIGLFSNERRNMNPYGKYKVVSSGKRKQIPTKDNLLQRLHSASNSAIIR